MAGRRRRSRALGSGLLIGIAILGIARYAQGTQTFAVSEIGFGNGPNAEVTADFNNDGKPDLAVANPYVPLRRGTDPHDTQGQLRFWVTATETHESP